MDATKMHVMTDIRSEFNIQGKLNDAIAELVCKDVTVVAKQFSEKSRNITLQTAYEYAAAAGGRIAFVRDDDWDFWHQDTSSTYGQVQEALSTANERVEYFKNLLQSEKKRAEWLEKLVMKLEMNLDKKEGAIDRKDAVIAKKDDVITELLVKNGVLHERQETTPVELEQQHTHENVYDDPGAHEVFMQSHLIME